MVIGLRKMLATHRDGIVDFVTTGLQKGDSTRYQKIDGQLLRTRVAALVDAFLAAMGGRRQGFIDFVRRLTEERLVEGYFVYEIIAVLNLMEGRVCDLVGKDSSERAVDRNLEYVSRTVSLTKDELVKIYFLGKQAADSRVDALERKLQDATRR